MQSQRLRNRSTSAWQSQDRLQRQLFERRSARFATTTPALSDYGGGARGHEKPHLCLGRKPALKLMQSSDDRFHPTTSYSGICRRKLVLRQQPAIPSGSARRTPRWCWDRFRYPGLVQDALRKPAARSQADRSGRDDAPRRSGVAIWRVSSRRSQLAALALITSSPSALRPHVPIPSPALR